MFFSENAPHCHRRDQEGKCLKKKTEYDIWKYYQLFENILESWIFFDGREKGPWRCAMAVLRINAVQWLSWTLCQLRWNCNITSARKTSPWWSRGAKYWYQWSQKIFWSHYNEHFGDKVLEALSLRELKISLTVSTLVCCTFCSVNKGIWPGPEDVERENMKCLRNCFSAWQSLPSDQMEILFWRRENWL